MRIVKWLLITVAALAAFVVLVKTLSERPDQCLCADGTRQSGWGSGWSTAASNCAGLCVGHGGGGPVP